MKHTQPGLLSHLRAVLIGPGIVTIVIPGVIIAATGGARINAPRPVELATTWLGATMMVAGMAMLVWTIALFARVGKGTLSLTDPTRALVVTGPYQHVRNPMISAVLAILLGEVIIARSVALLIWFAVFWTVLAILIPLVEEPKLARRFSVDYDRYRDNVPRWIPRPRPWNPSDQTPGAQTRRTGGRSWEP